MTPDSIDRYARQIMLKEIGGHGQKRCLASHVLIVGAGALSGPAALLLAGAGIGKITLFDDDRIERSNLHRQTQFTSDEIGEPKAERLAARIRRLNPDVDVTPGKNAGRKRVGSAKPICCSMPRTILKRASP